MNGPTSIPLRSIGRTLVMLATLGFSTTAGLADIASAQDLRVYTRVYINPGKQRSEAATPALRSNTLFHAGKAYDLLDTFGEITIFEPAHERFTIINSSRMLITELSFTEIENALHHTYTRAERSLDPGNPDALPLQEPVRKAIEFQLHPKFQVSSEQEGKRWKFEAPSLSYQISTVQSPDPTITEAYYRYADWTARLNFVLHPLPNLPNARIEVNRQLAARDVLPVTVTMESRAGKAMTARAEHSFEWKLGMEDRKQLKYWDELLNNPSYKRLTFSEFQKAIKSTAITTAKR